MAAGKSGLLVLLLSIALLSCSNSTEREDQLSQKIDSLSNQINQLQRQITSSEKDTTNTLTSSKDTSAKKNLPTSPVKLVPVQNPLSPLTTNPSQHQPVKNPVVKPAKAYSTSESEIYYYKSLPKRISVEITPWINGKRRVIFYDPFGQVTYTCDDVHLSYSTTTQLKKFHDNGAVSLIEIHDNPGASMYWYETQITFGINNEPQWKTAIQKPEMSLEQRMNNKYWWNDKAQQWVKQQAVEEQPYPGK